MSMIDIDRTEAELVALGSAQWTAFPGTIPGWVAESDFGVATEIKAAMRSAIDRELTGYLPGHETTVMRQATADWVTSELGWTIEPASVREVGDAMQGLENFLRHLTRPGSPVVVMTPAYEPFHTLPRYLGRAVVEVPLAVDRSGPFPRHVPDLEALRRALAAGAGSVIHCNPANPTGTVATRQELVEFAAMVGEFPGVRVFADEVHAPLTLGRAVHTPLASVSAIAAERTVTVYSASKGWNLAGLKCAQLVFSSPADLAEWDALGNFPGHGTSTLGVIANIAAYTVGRSWMRDLNEHLARNRAVLERTVAELLPDVAVTHSEATYLAWLDFSRFDLPVEPAEFLLEHARVSSYAGLRCGAVGAGHVRFRYSMPEPILVRAFERVAEALEPFIPSPTPVIPIRKGIS